MPKPKNVAPTQQITISTTPQVVRILGLLAEQGFHGKNVAEVAERLLTERLREQFVDSVRFSPRDLIGGDSSESETAGESLRAGAASESGRVPR